MQDFLPLITGSSGALVVLALWVWALSTGKMHSDTEFRRQEKECEYWRDAYDKAVQVNRIERGIVNETAQAGQVNNHLLAALVDLASGRKAAQAPGLTAEDLGPVP